MKWRGSEIVNLSRAFLDTNGVKQKTDVKVKAPLKDENYFSKFPVSFNNNINDMWIENLRDLNVASQKGMVEMFDSTIGGGAVLMPLGGITQLTPAEGMVCKVPLLEGDTKTSTIMTYGYNPQIESGVLIHGALYGILEAVAKSYCYRRRLQKNKTQSSGIL
jgi:phosphoribosylformylglycinamidine synthase